MKHKHTFHIPVMGIGFTIDTPLKVAQYGIDSVVSLVDDILIEKIRKKICEENNLPYNEITENDDDYRAKRVKTYLDTMNSLIEDKMSSIKNKVDEQREKVKNYFNMLPDKSDLKKEFKALTDKYLNFSDFENWIKENLTPGKIDVNIMTKLDKTNYKKNEQLPAEYNDAHASLRGFAESNLDSSVIFSAGMNPRLYSYLEKFKDFFPDIEGYIKKRIVIKVSDFRSALIQGKFLAKKGLWVSEFRIESGLNCGGHAFATDGYLLGPILEEFKKRKFELVETLKELFHKALEAKNKRVPEKMPQLKISVQGGVGTNEEHEFLIEHYNVDSVGWGSPFLLVPEATSVDEETIQKISKAKEEDLYLSHISPLGVRFNSLKGNTKDIEKQKLIEKGRPGSSCPKKFLVSNKEFSDKPICTASRQYQFLKLKSLQESLISDEEYQKNFDKVVDKSCICVGLGTSAMKKYDIDTKKEGDGVSVCPGPNMAYFSKVVSLKQAVDHIYGRNNIIERYDRPNMFIKELKLYLNFLSEKFEESKKKFSEKEEKYLLTFSENLSEGIEYYQELFDSVKGKFDSLKDEINCELEKSRQFVDELKREISNLKLKEAFV